MRRAILFRYHTEPDICRNRIALLRRFNPGIAIYGMYGGPRHTPPALPFNHNYVLPFESPRFKWQHGDLCARRWFIDVGHRYSFDMLHIVEWDLVLLKPLAFLYRYVKNGVALTGVKSISTWRAKNWYWIRDAKGNADLETLRTYAHKNCGEKFDDRQQKAGLFPGATLSRAFLEGYAEIDPPALLNDEVRTGLFAQAMGMKVHDTRLHINNPFFDCTKRGFTSAAVASAYPQHCVFHHLGGRVDLNERKTKPHFRR